MPWDFYLGRRLKKEVCQRSSVLLKKYQKITMDRIHFLFFSCRWGHCNREDELNSHLYFNNGSKKINCKFIEPVDGKVNNVRLYSCK